MKMETIVTVALFIGCAMAWGDDSTTNALPEGVKHPTQPGTYVMGEWTYTYAIRHKGSQSERRSGTLSRKGAIVAGEVGDVIDTSLGRFVWLDDAYDSGWLKTATYDKPLFDAKGRLVPDVKERVTALRDRKETKAQNKPPEGTH
jgi:hypothetical protein